MNRHRSDQFTVADVTDAQRIAVLAGRIWVEAYGLILESAQIQYMLHQRFELANLRRELQSPETRYWLVHHNGESVGYGSMSLKVEQDKLKIQQVYLESRVQGHGLGRGLLDVMTAVAKEYSVGGVWLTVNRHNQSAIEFYQRYGFEMTGTQVTDIGGGFVMDDFVLEKRLVLDGD